MSDASPHGRHDHFGESAEHLLDMYGPVDLSIVLKQDEPGGGWTGEVRWHGDEWATVHAPSRGRALDMIAGYVRAA